MMILGECVTDKTVVHVIGKNYRKKEEKGLVKRIFRKNFNHAEIIGEELCSIRNLSCPHFFLVADSMDNNDKEVLYNYALRRGLNVMLGSYDFTRNDLIYFTINDIANEGKNNLEKILSMCSSLENRRVLIDEICELFALDIYMGQSDRFSNNIMFSINPSNGDVHLAPIYDFQFSLKKGYTNSEKIYDNQICPIMTFSDLSKFIKDYPGLLEMLKTYLDVDLVSTIKLSYEKHGMCVPDDKLRFYSDFETDRKKLIKKITL